MNKVYMDIDVTGAKYLKMENSLYFLENKIFVVELPVSEHNKPKVKEAQMKKNQNLEN